MSNVVAMYLPVAGPVGIGGTHKKAEEVEGHRLSMVVGGAEEMEAFGARLAEAGLGPGCTVLLIGDLGTGKTCLARGVVRACLGDPDLPVTSPSYLLDNTYYMPEPEDFLIHHMDLYRLSANGTTDLTLLGFPDILSQDLCLIEWPDRLGRYLPPQRLEVHLQAVDDEEDTRRVVVQAVGQGWPKQVLHNLLPHS